MWSTFIRVFMLPNQTRQHLEFASQCKQVKASESQCKPVWVNVSHTLWVPADSFHSISIDSNRVDTNAISSLVISRQTVQIAWWKWFKRNRIPKWCISKSREELFRSPQIEFQLNLPMRSQQETLVPSNPYGQLYTCRSPQKLRN